MLRERDETLLPKATREAILAAASVEHEEDLRQREKSNDAEHEPGPHVSHHVSSRGRALPLRECLTRLICERLVGHQQREQGTAPRP